MDTDSDADPDEGAVSVCVACGMIALFTGVGRETRFPTKDEFHEIIADPLVAALVSDIYKRRRDVVARGRRRVRAGLN